MTLERVVHETLHEWSQDVAIPTDLADAALAAGRRRPGRPAALAAVAVLAVAVAIAAPSALLHEPARRPSAAEPTALGSPNATGPDPAPIPGWTPLALSHAHPGDTSVTAQPGESPPRHLVAAYDVAVSAWYTAPVDGEPTYHLLNTTSGTYVEVPYRRVDVTPGLGLAAVIEDPGHSRRVGLVDMATGQIDRWLATAVAVAEVAFSPDGTKLVAATSDPTDGSAGIALFDLVAGTVRYASGPSALDGTHVVTWTADGDYIYTNPYSDAGGTHAGWFHADGRPTAPPATGPALDRLMMGPGSVSPDGKRVFSWGDGSGGNGPITFVADLADGRIVGHQPMENLRAWASDGVLVAVQCKDACANEFINRFVAVDVDGTHVVPLTGYQTATDDRGPDHWQVLLTRR